MQNASRRGFLGLLAAVPVLGPAIAKEAIAAPRAISGSVSFSQFEAKLGELVRLNFSADDIDWSKITAPSSDYTDPQNEFSTYTPPSTPNRLYGTTINDDGDAT